ncbi:MAG TPA: DUF222 domain-containing protein [Acidimicrobiales bacterium]|nr:DUF222 domain-containing protein [Acidimicrobiales bacterium]
MRFFDRDSGMRALFGEWDPEATAPIERAVDLVAEQPWRALHPDRKPTALDEKTLKYRRAEAVSERVTAAKPRPAVVSLSVLIDFQTLTGVLATNGICELFDGTPISPDTVRRLACDAAIIPMVLGSRGEVLNQGRRIYAPTMAQRHWRLDGTAFDFDVYRPDGTRFDHVTRGPP